MRLTHSPQFAPSLYEPSLYLSEESSDSEEEFLAAVRDGEVDAVSTLLRENQIDLTSLHEGDGTTALHLAISHGHDDITRLLLEHAGNDSRVLDARDRQQYTPLMWAAAKRNVAMMKALIDAGASTDRTMLSGRHSGLSLQERYSLRIMSDTQGDISAAFEESVKASQGAMAKLFFDAGADSLAVFKRLVQARHWKGMAWMIVAGYVHGNDCLSGLSVVADMVQRGYGTSAKAVPRELLDPKLVMRTVYAMRKQSEPARIDALIIFRRAGVDLDSIVMDIVCSLGHQSEKTWAWKINTLRQLFAAGADTDGVLSYLAKGDDRHSVKKLISFGVDFVASIEELNESRSVKATWLVAYEALKFLLQSECSDTTKISRMKQVMQGAGTSVAVQLLEEELTLKHYDTVALLIAARVPATYLIADLCNAGNEAVARKLIELGADGNSSLDLLVTRARQHQTAGRYEDAGKTQDAANKLALILAAHYLPPGPSNPGTLIRPSV